VSSTAATDPCTSCRRSARAISACSCGFIPSATTIWYQIRRAEMLTGRVVPDGPHRRQGRPQDGHGRHPAADGYLHVPDQLPAHLQLSIGIWAPILLVLLRILQGLSASGEQAGANSMSFEHAPDQRRGYYTSWTLSGTVGGQVIAPAVVLPLSALLTDEQLQTWGWRIPFLLSAIVGWVAVSIFVAVICLISGISVALGRETNKTPMDDLGKKPADLVGATV
jgi:MFS family permease